MRKLILLMLLFIGIVTYAQHRGTRPPQPHRQCYIHSICEGQHYNYRAFQRRGGFFTEVVTVVRIKDGVIIYRRRNGLESAVNARVFDKNADLIDFNPHPEPRGERNPHGQY